MPFWFIVFFIYAPLSIGQNVRHPQDKMTALKGMSDFDAFVKQKGAVEWKFHKCSERSINGIPVKSTATRSLFYFEPSHSGDTRTFSVVPGSNLEMFPLNFSTKQKSSDAVHKRAFGDNTWVSEAEELTPFGKDNRLVFYSEAKEQTFIRKTIGYASAPLDGKTVLSLTNSNLKTGYHVVRFDNKGNYLNMLVLVEPGRKSFIVQATCGHGFGHTLGPSNIEITEETLINHNEDARKIELTQRRLLFAGLSYRMPLQTPQVTPSETKKAPPVHKNGAKKIEFQEGRFLSKIHRLNPEEDELGEIPPGSIIERDKNGKLPRDKNGKILITVPSIFAKKWGQNMTDHSVSVAKKTGSIVFSSQEKKIGRSIQDTIIHFITKMNENDKDLELVFMIDYSGSMSGSIKGAIESLQETSKYMEDTIEKAGRKVRMGIITFGERGKEKLETFTDKTGKSTHLISDIGEVRARLEQLLARYRAGTHSDNPGEAQYHAFNLLADPRRSGRFQWGTGDMLANRMVIMVTDEEAYEPLVPAFGATYVRTQIDHMNRARITVYPILIE